LSYLLTMMVPEITRALFARPRAWFAHRVFASSRLRLAARYPLDFLAAASANTTATGLKWRTDRPRPAIQAPASAWAFFRRKLAIGQVEPPLYGAFERTKRFMSGLRAKKHPRADREPYVESGEGYEGVRKNGFRCICGRVKQRNSAHPAKAVYASALCHRDFNEQLRRGRPSPNQNCRL
jgi:hypothetical protein